MNRIIALLAIAASALALSAAPASARSASPSCLKALDASDQLRSASSTFVGDVGSFFQNVHDNATTNDTNPIGFINQLTTDIQAFTAQAAALTPGIKDASTRLTMYEGRCRAGR